MAAAGEGERSGTLPAMAEQIEARQQIGKGWSEFSRLHPAPRKRPLRNGSLEQQFSC
jgi:hypothetical protein